jgi:exosortase
MNQKPSLKLSFEALRVPLAVLFALGAALTWAYWTTFVDMAERWSRDAEYSHGYLVPGFAVWLLWMRREQLDPQKLKASAWGLVLLLGAFVLRFIGARYYLEWFDLLSLVPCLAGIGLLLGGPHAFRWFWPAVCFLFFMMPLPHSLEYALREPLRNIGTVGSTYVMQTCGLPALSEGNVILVEDVRIGVVEACSGLRMLLVFFALSTAVALISERPYWQRAIIVLSAVPIALLSNMTRITVTGMLYGMKYHELADLVFHDLAGWLMMPLGLGMLWFELWFLSKLFVVEINRPLAVGLAGSSRAATPVRAQAAAPRP